MCSFNILVDDTLRYIFDFLPDIDKFSFSSLNKKMASFREKLELTDEYDYYDYIDFPIGKIRNIRYLTHRASNIPNNITHLIFTKHFNEEFTKEVIPKSVRKITFGCKFNKSINNLLPMV